jgi:DNA invertase Pin-like site-specific DNA recombinase
MKSTTDIAIYTRQSVDKKDSLSIETQIEECKQNLTQDEIARSTVFTDRGFSGKNTDRPDFQQMMEFVRAGAIKKIIVYKLDRISRSILDFSNMYAEFEKYGMEFYSCLERFDTSTPLGKAMLFIIAVFAEMERQTIQQRIKDNYYARGEKAFYLGGYAPFGYNKCDYILDGKKTYYFEENKMQADIVRFLYEQYALENTSIGDLVRWLNTEKIEKRRKGSWNSSGISTMLSNPVYVKADSRVYTFFKTKGATINNPVDDFVGENGCYFYGKPSDRTGGTKFKKIDTDFVTIAPHKGIINADIWLAAQERFERNRGHTNAGHGCVSWLQGLVRCVCGYSLYAKKSVSRNTVKPNTEYRYFYCRGRRQSSCTTYNKMFRVDRLEAEVELLVFEQLEKLRNIETYDTPQYDPKINTLRIEQKKVQEQIENLIEQLKNGTATTNKYLNEEIERLDSRKLEIDQEILLLERSASQPIVKFDVDDIIADWKNYDIEQKKRIVQIFIQKIEINGLEADIKMK